MICLLRMGSYTEAMNTRTAALARPAYVAPVLLLACALLFAAPQWALAVCYQTASYPPQTYCTPDGQNTNNTNDVIPQGTPGASGGNTGPSSPIQLPAVPGLAALWHFDESSGVANDISGNGNTGILENGATRYVGTQNGNKLLLDGVDDRMRVDSVSSSMQNMNTLSLMAWVRPEENGGIILRKGNSDPARFNFGITHDGSVYFRAGYSERSGVWITQAKVPVNAWSHVAVSYTYGVSNKPTLYINGIAQTLRSSVSGGDAHDAADPAGTPVADTPYLYVGNNHTFANESVAPADSAFEGRMDIVRIYNIVQPDWVFAFEGAPTMVPDMGVVVPSTNTGTGNAEGNSGPVSTVAMLQNQLNTLLAQITNLQPGQPSSPTVYPTNTTATGATWQQQTYIPTATAAYCPTLSRSLWRGMSGQDVRELQIFLINQGLLAAGLDTGYFGTLTENAVRQFQDRNGISRGAGDRVVVGPLTRAAIQAACGQ